MREVSESEEVEFVRLRHMRAIASSEGGFCFSLGVEVSSTSTAPQAAVTREGEGGRRHKSSRGERGVDGQTAGSHLVGEAAAAR